MTGDDEGRALQVAIRNAAAVGMLLFLGAIVLAAVLTRPLTGEPADVALLLGLAGALIGALLALLGIQTIINKGR